MTESAILQYIATALPAAQVAPADGNYLFFAGPDRKLPFATLITNDQYDAHSNLARPGIFRLNLGLSRATYIAHFGPPPTGTIGSAGFPAHDFTALNKLLPHPVYAQMAWVCILNPTPATFQTLIQPLLAEAYAEAVKYQAARAAQ